MLLLYFLPGGGSEWGPSGGPAVSVQALFPLVVFSSFGQTFMLVSLLESVSCLERGDLLETFEVFL